MSMLVLNPKPQTLNPTIMASGTGTRTTGEVPGAADSCESNQTIPQLCPSSQAPGAPGLQWRCRPGGGTRLVSCRAHIWPCEHKRSSPAYSAASISASWQRQRQAAGGSVLQPIGWSGLSSSVHDLFYAIVHHDLLDRKLLLDVLLARSIVFVVIGTRCPASRTLNPKSFEPETVLHACLLCSQQDDRCLPDF